MRHTSSLTELHALRVWSVHIRVAGCKEQGLPYLYTNLYLALKQPHYKVVTANAHALAAASTGNAAWPIPSQPFSTGIL